MHWNMWLFIGLFWHMWLFTGLFWHMWLFTGLFWHTWLFVRLFWHVWLRIGVYQSEPAACVSGGSALTYYRNFTLKLPQLAAASAAHSIRVTLKSRCYWSSWGWLIGMGGLWCFNASVQETTNSRSRRRINRSNLQCVAVCCSVLQCVAVCCSML